MSSETNVFKRVLFLILMVAVMILGQGAEACAEDDIQYWSAYEISKELGQGFEVFYSPQFRLKDDVNVLFYHEHRSGVRWKPSKHLKIGFHYFYARNQSSTGKWLSENRGELEVTPNLNVGNYNLSARGRVELRQIEGSSGEEEWRFRVMPKVSYATEVFGHQVKPYIANDIFYDLERDAWNQNRAYLGAVFPLKEVNGVKPSINIFYMLKHNRSALDDWSSNHILGSKLGLRF